MTPPLWLRIFGACLWVAGTVFVLVTAIVIYRVGHEDGRAFECRMGFEAVETYAARAGECDRLVYGEVKR